MENDGTRPARIVAVHPDRSRSWWRRLAPAVAHRWPVLSIAAVSAVVAMVAQVALPRVVMGAVDNALVAGTDSLERYVVILIGLACLRGVATFGYRYGFQSSALRLEADLRVTIHDHLSHLSHEYYDRVQSGQIISRANADLRSIQMFGAFAPIVSIQIVTVVGAISVMASIDLVLTLVAVAALPGVYLAAQQLRDQVFPLSWLVSARQADLATVIDENISGAQVVKAFAAERRQIAVFVRAARRLHWISVVLADTRARWNPIVEALPRLSLAAVLAVGGWRAADGQVTVGALLAFSQYVLLLATPFRFVGFVIMLGQRARASADRVFEILDESPSIVESPAAVDLERAAGEIRFEGVHFAYRDQSSPVLHGIDLVVPAGQTIAIVGRSASGKSTLARLIPRFYDPDRGVVRLDGHDVRSLTLSSLRRNVAFVPDDPFIFSTSLRDNIAYAAPDAGDDAIAAAARDAGAATFIDDLGRGMATVVGERGADLSGGQRQRAALARGLVGDPAVLLLDDATSAVDVTLETRIHEALTERRHGRTTVLIAHRLSTVALADRVVMIDGGRIVADGSHEHLLATSPAYAALIASTNTDLDTSMSRSW